MLATIASWALYAFAALCVAITLALAVTAGKGRSFVGAHLAVGTGVAILAAALGYTVGNDLSLLQTGITVLFGTAGYALVWFGRRRVREVNHYVNAMYRAQQKQAHQSQD